MELIKSSGGTGPMKLRQPFDFIKTVPNPVGEAYKMRVSELSFIESFFILFNHKEV